MILIGEAKIHANNLPDASYYINNKNAVANSLFKETAFGIRFTPVLLETLKRTHKTLTYILRNQYAGAEQVFRNVLELPKENIINGQESVYCFNVYERMQECLYINEYSKHVIENLIQPTLKRFGYYSPTMSYVLFI